MGDLVLEDALFNFEGVNVPEYDHTQGLLRDLWNAFQFIDGLEGELCIGTRTDRIYQKVQVKARGDITMNFSHRPVRLIAYINRFETLLNWNKKASLLVDLPGIHHLDIKDALFKEVLEKAASDDYFKVFLPSNCKTSDSGFWYFSDDFDVACNTRVDEYCLLFRAHPDYLIDHAYNFIESVVQRQLLK